MLTSLTRTVLNVLGTLPFVPAALRDRAAGDAARSIGPDVVPMSPDEAALHAPPGTRCASCGEPLEPTDPVRALKKGVVHDVCPR